MLLLPSILVLLSLISYHTERVCTKRMRVSSTFTTATGSLSIMFLHLSKLSHYTFLQRHHISRAHSDGHVHVRDVIVLPMPMGRLKNHIRVKGTPTMDGKRCTFASFAMWQCGCILCHVPINLLGFSAFGFGFAISFLSWMHHLDDCTVVVKMNQN